MSMRNTDRDFYGRQEDEKILYVVHPHPLAITVNLVKIYLISAAVFIVLVVLGSQIPSFSSLFFIFGLILAIVMVIVGTKIVSDYQKREIAYITDRRLIRFEPTTLFATNSRTLTWDEVVKVKTYPPNFVWKQLAIGNVVVHSRTPEGGAADDIQLTDVYYYKDLGNYIDKILFTYKQKPKDIALIHPFIPKPKGERY